MQFFRGNVSFQLPNFQLMQTGRTSSLKICKKKIQNFRSLFGQNLNKKLQILQPFSPKFAVFQIYFVLVSPKSIFLSKQFKWKNRISLIQVGWQVGEKLLTSQISTQSQTECSHSQSFMLKHLCRELKSICERRLTKCENNHGVDWRVEISK